MSIQSINNKLFIDHDDYTTVGSSVNDLATNSTCIMVVPATTNDAITGFVPEGVLTGEWKWVINNHASKNLVLKHNTGSTAGSRIFTSAGTDLTLTPYQQAQLMYVDDPSRPGWWVLNT